MGAGEQRAVFDLENALAAGMIRKATSGGSDMLIGADDTQLIPSNIKCPFYDAPLAKGNRGLVVFFTDVGSGQLCFSDDYRWKPVGGRVNAGVKYNAVPTRSGTFDSKLKIKIPYSPLNGSFLQNGDMIRVQASYQRLFMDAGDNTKFLIRRLLFGRSSNPIDNKELLNSYGAIANDGCAEHNLVIKRTDSSTMQLLGKQVVFNMWDGNTTTDLYSINGITDIDNMDMQDVYLDYGFNFGTSNTVGVAATKDAAHLYSCFVEIITCGSGD
jgi:hypothetical protein